ncbi:hypothetical protein B6I21_05625 [candidate division KSB1 bacterium 4572_119]|nr:MAG: hypothetical protein B6I21_05625 [candidate division KSB1 bacterium 4572_119]
MKINYYTETDSLYIDLSSKVSVDSIEITEGIVIDFDEDKNIVGIDIDNAKSKLNLDELILNKLPLKKQIMTV